MGQPPTDPDDDRTASGTTDRTASDDTNTVASGSDDTADRTGRTTTTRDDVGTADATGSGSGRSADRTSDSTTDPETRDRRRFSRVPRGAIDWLSALAAIVGLWIAVSPFVYDTTEAALWNNVIVGVAIFLLASYNFYQLNWDRFTNVNVGSASLIALLGLWLIVAPFLIVFDSTGLIWSTIVSGAVIVLLSGYNAYQGRRAEAAAARGTRT